MQYLRTNEAISWWFRRVLSQDFRWVWVDDVRTGDNLDQFFPIARLHLWYSAQRTIGAVAAQFYWKFRWMPVQYSSHCILWYAHLDYRIRDPRKHIHRLQLKNCRQCHPIHVIQCDTFVLFELEMSTTPAEEIHKFISNWDNSVWPEEHD